jgi:hypothetical protein
MNEGDAIREHDEMLERIAGLERVVDRLSLAVAKLAIAAGNVDVLGVDVAVSIGDGSLR